MYAHNVPTRDVPTRSRTFGAEKQDIGYPLGAFS